MFSTCQNIPGKGYIGSRTFPKAPTKHSPRLRNPVSSPHLLLDDGEGGVVLGEKEDVACLPALLPHRLHHQLPGRLEQPRVHVGVDSRQEHLSRLEVPKVAAKVPLHGVGDILLAGLSHVSAHHGVDHLDQAVEVPQTKVLSLLPLIDLFPEVGKCNLFYIL